MQLMNTFERYLAPAGRIIVGVYFLLAGLDKITGLSGTAGYIESIGLPAGMALAILATMFEIATGLALITGFWAKRAALALAGFVVVVSFLFHSPGMWAENPMQQVLFMKNVAIFGSLLFVAAHAGMAATLSMPKTKDPIPTL